MTQKKKRIVIIGATSAIAENCARLWAKENDVDFILVGRNLTKTEHVAADLRVRNPRADITTQTVNFEDPFLIQKFADDTMKKGPVDILLIAFGLLPNQKTCEQDLAVCQNALYIDAISPVLFSEAFAGHMQTINFGSIVIIGSVAGDRGKKSNYIYGAAKGLLARYAEGLSHRFANYSGIHITIVKPGPTQTPMTAHMKQKMASVESVANDIVIAVSHKKSVCYTPKKWALIMRIAQHIPRFIFNKLDI